MTREQLKEMGYMPDEIEEIIFVYEMEMAYGNCDDGIPEEV